jgi:uncharacterized surface anchored protein
MLGGVHDPTGAVLIGATVVITDVERGISRTLTTGEAGDYAAPDIPPGLYKVSAASAGF